MEWEKAYEAARQEFHPDRTVTLDHAEAVVTRFTPWHWARGVVIVRERGAKKETMWPVHRIPLSFT